MVRDVEYEHEPAEHGTVRSTESVDEEFRDGKVVRMQQDVEIHGEVHATFQDVEREVEVRLRTATFNYDDDIIEIWDGDNEHIFAMDALISWYCPMDVFHK